MEVLIVPTQVIREGCLPCPPPRNVLSLNHPLKIHRCHYKGEVQLAIAVAKGAELDSLKGVSQFCNNLMNSSSDYDLESDELTFTIRGSYQIRYYSKADFFRGRDLIEVARLADSLVEPNGILKNTHFIDTYNINTLSSYANQPSSPLSKLHNDFKKVQGTPQALAFFHAAIRSWFHEHTYSEFRRDLAYAMSRI